MSIAFYRAGILGLIAVIAFLIWQPGEPSVPPAAATITPRDDLGQEEQSTIALFANAAPSVVHITTHAWGRDYFSLNVTEIPQGTGTGIVWDKQGHIVTNLHVIQEADTANIALADHSTWQAELVGVAPEKDLAVLKIKAPAELLHPLPVGTSKNLQVGQRAIVIGNPFGLDHTLTMGVISALGREIDSPAGRPIKDVIQTDAAINPGNSGGPLLDSTGRLIGVTTAIFSPSGAYAGIGLAIPVDTVRWVVPELITHGKIIRPGIAATFAQEQLGRRLGVEGTLILSVEPESQASQAGLRATRMDRSGRVYLGDIIVAVDDAPIQSANDLLSEFEKRKVGDVVKLTIERGEERVAVPITLEATD